MCVTCTIPIYFCTVCDLCCLVLLALKPENLNPNLHQLLAFFLHSAMTVSLFCRVLLQYQQHLDGHGEHSVQWPLHPRHAQRPRQWCSGGERLGTSRGQVSELHMLLGSVSAAVPQQPRPGRTHQGHTCGWTERRGQCLSLIALACRAFTGVEE